MSFGPASRTECFNEPLPALNAKSLTYKKVRPSETTTKEAVPPLILRHVPIKQLSDFADNVLRGLQLTGAITTTFPQLPLDSESDVVNASMLYVIQPIMEILHALCPGKWTVHTQLNDKLSPNKLESLVDPDTKISELVVRYDLVIKTTSEHANPDKTIAVLEYKRRELIRYNDFKPVMISDADELSDILEFKRQRQYLQEQGQGLVMNGVSYSKQVSRYAQISECKHVALFNWQNLLLFNFNLLGVS